MFFKKNYRAASKLPYPAAFFCFCPFYLQRGIQDLQESEEFQVQKENRWDSHPFTNILHQVTHRNTSAVCHKMPSSLSLDEVLLGFFFLTGSSGSWWSWWNTGPSWIQGKVLFCCDGLLRCTDPQSCRLQKLLPLNVKPSAPVGPGERGSVWRPNMTGTEETEFLKMLRRTWTGWKWTRVQEDLFGFSPAEFWVFSRSLLHFCCQI